MTLSEYYTTQFYAWESRGRGWYVSDQPVQLEPPFMPYYRHGYPGENRQLDDGRRHTLVSKFLENFREKKQPVATNQNLLDYETLESIEPEEVITLAALQIKLPGDRKPAPEKMKAMLIMLSYIKTPISFEIIGTATAIILQFVCDEDHTGTLETYLHAYFPNCSIQHAATWIDNILDPYLSTAVVDFGLKQEFVRPIHTGKSPGMDPLIGVFAVLEKLSTDEQAGLQVLFQPVQNQWTASILRSVTMHDGTSFFKDVPEAPQLAKEKVQSPLYGVTIRTFAQAEELHDAFHILENISFALINGTKGTNNELIPLSTQAYDFQTRVDDIFNRESHRLGMLLNTDELVSMVHFPSESISSKKLFAASRKTKEVPAIAKGKAFILGQNNHNDITTPVSFSIEDRLKHTHIIGATGTGKSTLIASLIMQDIEEGIGVVLFDPHGDLVDDIIARIPKGRMNDVVLVDPSDIEYPIGLNILQAHSDIEKEVLSSDLVAAFRKYATSWGDQMNAVFGNAILAILEHKKGGSLSDLRRFLIEKEFRYRYLKDVTDPSVLYYWQKEYPLLKTNSIGPILTRLDTFLRPKSIRNMVVQQTGLDFESLLNDNKIVLLKLSQGLIGVENSFLLGSLMLSKIHQAVFRRQQQSSRNPIFIYLDEFQNFITPSIKEMLSGIRKYNVGLTLSHQDLQQLQREDGELLNSVLGNINTRIVFRVGEPDAKKLQDGFSGFDYTDLQNLGRGEAVIRIEQPQFDCSLDTLAPQAVPEAQREQNQAAAIAHAREHYAASKDAVEAMLLQTLNLDIHKKEEKKEDKKENRKVGKTENNKEELLQEKQQPPKAKETYTQREEPIEPLIESTTKPPKEPTIKESAIQEAQRVTDKATASPAPKPVYQKTKPIEPPRQADTLKTDTDISTHRYLQTLVKKMAEASGYTAVLEMQLPDGSGNVDVLLSKDNKTIAVEICVTTDPDWEMHNIQKCLTAQYDMVISLCGDPKQLDKIKKKCKAGISNFEQHPVQFFTPDALFAFLNTAVTSAEPQEQIIKGYRVNVTYDSLSQEEMDRKRASVTKVVMDALRRQKRKE
jgi:Helicase HerA, central domain/TraM recognition site of TraD and TraG